MLDYTKNCKNNIKQVSAGFIVISGGKILLGKSSKSDKERSWGVFKGKVEGEENIFNAACRELREESGIDINSNEYLQKSTSTVPVLEFYLSKGKKKVVLFLLNDQEGILDNFDFHCEEVNGKKEISDYKWFDTKEIAKKIFWSQKKVIDFLDKN